MFREIVLYFSSVIAGILAVTAVIARASKRVRDCFIGKFRKALGVGDAEKAVTELAAQHEERVNATMSVIDKQYNVMANQNSEISVMIADMTKQVE